MNSIKATARRAGALDFLFLIVGLVDMYGFSHFIVPGDASATARNIIAAQLTYRILIFIFLVVSLYNLLKGVDQCVRARCFSGRDALGSRRVPDNLLASHQGSKGAGTKSRPSRVS